MALSKIDTPALVTDAVDNTILDVADNFAFTGTVTGAGLTSPFASTVAVTSEGGAVTTNLAQGLAKFWIRHASASAIRDSFNATSVTDNGTGDFTVVIANNMSNANYSFITTSGSDGGNNFAGSRLRSGSSGDCRCIYGYNDATLYDWAQICVSIDGDLA